MTSTDLRDEFRSLSSYLTATPASDELCQRYERAHVLRLPAVVSPYDAAFVRCVRRFPSTLRYADAFQALFRRNGVLRKKLLLALSILETSPTGADGFDWPGTSRVAWFWHMALTVARFAVDAAGGLAIGAVLWFDRRAA